ncbi:MAG: class I SAM-dependent methyltransferase [Spirochaetota bacterium]
MLTVDFDTLNLQEGHYILDAGCGGGRHSFECISRGAHVWSMDMDMESVRRARYTLAYMKEKGQAHKNGRYLVQLGDALRLPFKDNSFDRIICAEVMEHVDDDYQACGELARVVKPGGVVAITVPTFITEMAYDVLTYEYFTSPGGHVRKYIPRKLASIMDSNGLDVYAVDFKHSFHTIYWIIRSVVGLHLNKHPVSKGYHSFLVKTMDSRLMEKVENFFDNFFPKSIILYAVKR